MELGSPVDCHILTFAAGLRGLRGSQTQRWLSASFLWHVKPGHKWWWQHAPARSYWLAWSFQVVAGRQKSFQLHSYATLLQLVFLEKNQCMVIQSALQPLRSSFLRHRSGTASWNWSNWSTPLEYYLVLFKGLGLGVNMLPRGSRGAWVLHL